MNFNPIVKRDMKVSSRSGGLAGFIAGLNACLFACGLLVLFGSLMRMQEAGRMNYRALFLSFSLTVILLSVIILFIFPGRTLSSVSQERDSGTIDIMMATGLSPLRIALGKFLSSFLPGTVIVLSCFPALFIPLILGGVSFQSCVLLLLSLIPAVALSLSAGLFGSAAGKNGTAGAVICYALILFLTVGPFFIAFLARPFLSEGGNSFVYLSALCPAFPAVALMLLLTGSEDLLFAAFTFLGLSENAYSVTGMILCSLGCEVLFSVLLFFLTVRKIAPRKQRR